MSHSERTPLLWEYNNGQVLQYEDRRERRQLAHATTNDLGNDVHSQFCALVGCPPSNAPPDYKYRMSDKSLYGRATRLFRTQNRTYMFSASVSNTLLLVQVVLGAALTGLGASNSPGWVITLFGATNTVIAGLVAYLKSRGQPMRARMYRDDLERVVDEIENSEVMWLGISQNVHGYDDINTDDDVTVRSEVARLTRLYDRAVRNNTMNNPDMYMAGQTNDNNRAGLRNYRGTGPQMTNVAVPTVLPPVENDPSVAVGSGAAATVPAAAPAPAAPAADPDESPASAPPKPKEEPKKETSSTAESKPSASGDAAKKPEGEPSSSTSAPAPAPTPGTAPPSAPVPATSSSSTTTTPAVAAAQPPTEEDPDASPATKPKFTKKSNTNNNNDSESGDPPKKVSGGGDDE